MAIFQWSFNHQGVNYNNESDFIFNVWLLTAFKTYLSLIPVCLIVWKDYKEAQIFPPSTLAESLNHASCAHAIILALFPNHNKPPKPLALLCSLSHFQTTLEPFPAFHRKVSQVSNKPFIPFWCMCGIISLDIWTRFVRRWPCPDMRKLQDKVQYRVQGPALTSSLKSWTKTGPRSTFHFRSGYLMVQAWDLMFRSQAKSPILKCKSDTRSKPKIYVQVWFPCPSSGSMSRSEKV